MEHQHRFWPMGGRLECACGAAKADERTDEQINAQRSAATTAWKARYNAAWYAAHPKSR